METAIMIAQLLLGLTILVFVHEMGHFLAARMFGIRVDKFFIFFDAWGVKLFSIKLGNTEYGIGWLPLGGYVKIAGMIDESMDKEQLRKPPQPDEYRSKPAWQRLIVISGGILFNIMLGIIIYSMYLYHFEKNYLQNDAVSDGVFAGELAREVGLRNGDRVTAINQKPFERFSDLYSLRIFFGATFSVDRNGAKKEIVIPSNFYKKLAQGGKERFLKPRKAILFVMETLPGSHAEKAGLKKNDTLLMADGQTFMSFEEFQDILKQKKGNEISLLVRRGNTDTLLTAQVDTSGKVGFAPGMEFPYPFSPYTLASSIRYGAADAFEALIYNAVGLSRIFTGEIHPSESVASPIRIATFYGGNWDWKRFWYFTAVLSMVLAFVNFLPIPALDGGHAMFLTYEIITRRPPGEHFMEIAQTTGIVLLVAIMLYAVGNDIWKLIR